MGNPPSEKHQLAGFDDRQRGFNRVVEVAPVGTVYRATLKYESAQIAAEGPENETAALHHLIRQLHDRGYRQLRTQVSFRGEVYLGNRAPWVEYPDPPISFTQNLWSRWFGRREK